MPNKLKNPELQGKLEDTELLRTNQHWKNFLDNIEKIREPTTKYINKLQKTSQKNKKTKKINTEKIKNQNKFQENLLQPGNINIKNLNKVLQTIQEDSYFLFTEIANNLLNNKTTTKQYLKIQTRDLNLYKTSKQIRDYIEDIPKNPNLIQQFESTLGTKEKTNKEFTNTLIDNLHKIIDNPKNRQQNKKGILKLEQLCRQHLKTNTQKTPTTRLIREEEIPTLLSTYRRDLEQEIGEHEISVKQIIKAKDRNDNKYTLKFRTKTTGRTLGKLALYILNQRKTPPSDLIGIEIVTPDVKKIYKTNERIQKLMETLNIETTTEYKGFFKEISYKQRKDKHTLETYDKKINEEIQKAVTTKNYNIEKNKENLLTSIKIRGKHLPMEIQIKTTAVNTISTGTGILSHDNKYYLQREIKQCDQIIENLKHTFNEPMKIYETLYKTLLNQVTESLMQ